MREENFFFFEDLLTISTICVVRKLLFYFRLMKFSTVYCMKMNIYRDPSAFIVHDGSYCHVTAIIEKVVTEMFKFYNFYFIFNRLLRHFFFF